MPNIFDALIHSLSGRALILHAGTSKTGTTSLQHWLFKQKQWLFERGILYPSNILSSQEPKHQWLIDAHQTNGADLLTRHCQSIQDELKKSDPANSSSILLSTEGLSNHFFDLVQPNRDSWIELTHACQVRIIITFRDPLQYSLSRYRQNLINPPSRNNYHATSLSLDQICADPQWLRALDYRRIVSFWTELVGDDSLICLPYRDNIIDTFLRFGLGLDSPPDSSIHERSNRSIGAVGVRLIREFNELRISAEARSQVIDNIRAAEAALDSNKHPFRHSEFSRQNVQLFCASTLPELVAKRPELTLELRDSIKSPSQVKPGQKVVRDSLANQSLVFICCIQPGFLEEQVVRLAQSIRLFAESHSNYPIYAVSPQGETISSRIMHKLESLAVTLIVKDLNKELAHFAYANKAYSIEYVQSQYNHDAYIFLDSDTLFVDEPSALCLDEDIDFLARPVDMRNICSSPLDDVNQQYWRSCCQLAGVELTDLPIIMSTVDKQVIRANWNGGLLMFRGNTEIGTKWRHLIENMWRRRLLAKPNSFWGSGQVGFTLAACSLNMRGLSLSRDYNIPMHLPSRQTRIDRIEQPRHIHYHWLFDSEYQAEWSEKLASLRLKHHTRQILEAMPTSKQKTKRNITGFDHQS